MPAKRNATLAALAVAGGAAIAAILLFTGAVGDDGGGGGTTGPGEQNEFVPSDKNTIVADGRAFRPGSLTVKVGDAVAFENNDDVPHTFTADDGLFDSRQVEPDGRYGFTMPRKGTVSFHCEIHPQMKGTITVEP